MKILSAAFVLGFALHAFAQVLNTTLIENIGYSQPVLDIWGHIDSQGNDYALVGLATGVSIVKVEQRRAYEVDRVPGVASGWRDIKTHSHYAYVTNEAGNGLMIIDLSTLPDSVRLVKEDIRTFSTAHNLSIADGFAYIAGWSRGAGAKILDLTDPENPVEAGQSNLSYYHDVFVQNNIMYASTGSRGSVALFDVSIKNQSKQLGEIFFPAAGYSHNSWASVDGRLVMTTEETAGKSVKVWDITNIRNPEILSEYLAAPGSVAHNVYIKGDYAYVAHYAHGVRILDIWDPANMVEVGYYDTYRGDVAGFEGCWGVFPFTNSGYIYASDQTYGLFVLAFEDQKGTRFKGRLVNSSSDAPLDEATILVTETGDRRTSDINGEFRIAFDQAGTYNMHFTKSGFETTFTSITLSEGETVTQEIKLTPSSISAVPGAADLPSTFGLLQNYPNPFNAETAITYEAPRQTPVTLAIFDLRGHEVVTLVNGNQIAGQHRVRWSGKDKFGRRVSSGIYFYKLTTPQYGIVKKMVLVE